MDIYTSISDYKIPIRIINLPCSNTEYRPILQHFISNEDNFIKTVQSYFRVPSDTNLKIRLQLKDGTLEDLDYKWEIRILSYFKKMLEMERVLWCLSTLGGAYSAMGDYDKDYAETAAQISKNQLALALEIGDIALVARCHLYLALSDAQRGLHRKAVNTVKMIYHWANINSEDLVIRCSTGVFNKIVSIRMNMMKHTTKCCE
ncbi:unnamed protein product [Auanema sp. JU1783]|nr:unnamed protein product [Auanema sp. JU1783]